MRIAYNNGVDLVKEKVIREFTYFFETESGAQVRKGDVIKIDRRGGKVEGAGRKSGEPRVPCVLYVTSKDSLALQEEAILEGCSVSSLLCKKLGLD